MGIFDRAEVSAEPVSPTGESRLSGLDDWNALVAESETGPVLVFKHSTVCGISAHVLADVRDFVRQRGAPRLAVLHVVENRSLSNAISEQTGVRHETPQLIAIENGHAVWHASH